MRFILLMHFFSLQAFSKSDEEPLLLKYTYDVQNKKSIL